MDYKGVCAVVIVSTLGASLMLTVIAMAWRDRKLTEAGAQVLTATVSGMLVALGYYMGSKQ